MVVIIGCVISIYFQQTNKGEKDEQCTDIPSIVFPQYAGEYNGDIKFELKLDKEIDNSENLNEVYLLDNEIDNSTFENIVKSMDFSASD